MKVLSDEVPNIEIRINNQVLWNNSIVWNQCSYTGWIPIEIPFTTSLTTAFIEMRNLNGTTYGNHFAIDDITFHACTDIMDWTVNVSSPAVSPSGPIDYHYMWEQGKANYTFTSPSPAGNQWLVDGVPVAGAINQTFNYQWHSYSNSNETHQISLQVNQCTSSPVTINFLPYGDCNPNCGFPVGINTPFSHCFNTTNAIRTFDLGPNANYSWTIIPTPWYTSTASISNIVQNTATVTVTSGSYAEVPIIAKSELNGYVKVFDYYIQIGYPLDERYYVCASWPKIPITVGRSGWDTETYNFGNGIVAPGYPGAGTNTSTVNGNNPTYIEIYRNGISSYSIKHRLSRGDCSEGAANLIVEACKFASGTATSTSIFPNPAKNKVEINSTEPILDVEIIGLNIFFFKHFPANRQKNISLSLRGFRPGVYMCKVMTVSKTEFLKLLIQD